MRKDPTLTPRQRVLDAHAREKGRNTAEFPDGQSYRMLQEEKQRVGSSTYTGNGLTDSYEAPATNASGEEKARYRALMEKSYDAGKLASARAQGKPTGYDAAMRGASSSSTSAAMEKMRRLAQAAKKKP